MKPYIFVFGGKFLETDSLLDLRSGIDDDKWDSIVACTIDSYLQMNSIQKSKLISLDDKDVKLVKSLKRTVRFIEQIDPISHSKFHTAERIEFYRQTVANEMRAASTLQIKSGGKLDGQSDIIVSALD